MSEINDRYETIRELGFGGQGHTSLALDRETGHEVVLKTLDFDALGSWKDLELFEREIEILRSLDHPGIPKLVEVYNDESIIVVYEYVEGDPVEPPETASSDECFDEAQAREFLTQMLGILEYLHGLIPPVVHRDIKPSNIIRRPDGSYALIDFGAAQASTNFTGGSTFVGTNGYMAPEQLMGRAEPRSDLYSLGATTLQLMTGIHPSLLTGEGLRLDTEGHIDGAMKIVIDLLTHPLPENRYTSATEAKTAVASQSTALAIISPGTLVATRTPSEVAVVIPSTKQRIWLYLMSAPFVAMSFAIEIWVGVAVLMVFLFFFRSWWRSQHNIRLVREGIIVERGHGPLKSRKTFPRSEILLVEDFAEADAASSHVILQLADGKQAKLGYGLERRQRRFIVDLLTDHLDVV